MKKYSFFIILTATALLLLSGCGMSTVQIFNNIKGEPYANADKYTAGELAISTTSADVDICRNYSFNRIRSSHSCI